MTAISVAVSLTAFALRTVPLTSFRFLFAVNSKKDKHSVMGSRQIHDEALKMSACKAAALAPMLGKSRVVGRGESELGICPLKSLLLQGVCCGGRRLGIGLGKGIPGPQLCRWL